MNDNIEVFFYGLFMDPDALRAQGLSPQQLRKASVRGFELKIGSRATLIPSANSVAHGIVMTLDREELDRLYSEPSVAAYRPEVVSCECDDGSSVAALCYNLHPWDGGPSNAGYGAKLRAVAERLGLPADYVEAIR